MRSTDANSPLSPNSFRQSDSHTATSFSLLTVCLKKMYLVRLLIVGETGVGKTSLLVRFNEDNFISDQKTTIGVDYKAKEVEIDDELVKLQVYKNPDTF